jgi:type I restriction enzyme M protein
MRAAEFDSEKEWWNKREETEYSWKVAAADIVNNNYNLDVKNPNAPIKIHDNPDILLQQYHDSLALVHQLQIQLRDTIAESLGN